MIDAYGATEGGVAVNRDAEERAGALGQIGDNVQVVDEDGNRSRRRSSTPTARLLNADECVGEIVNTAGAGPFEGYYNNDAANEKTLRFGWYWTGDLGYVDEDRYLYFAGRNADWLRVDGENFPAQPIENAIAQHPDVVLAAVYGVPDDQAGDQVMAGLVLRDGAAFDPDAFSTLARRTGRRRPEVATALRPGAARSTDDGHEQDREAFARAPEVARRPCRGRPGLRARPRRAACIASSRPTTSARCTIRSCSTSASASGICDPCVGRQWI